MSGGIRAPIVDPAYRFARTEFEYQVARMYRSSWAACLCAAVFLVVGLPAGEAQAQGFFQKLFGFGFSKPKPQPRIYRDQASRHQSRGYLPWGNDFSTQQRRPRYSSGSYRTMCVRTCDGFYFPISSNARRRDFHRDAEACTNSCGAEAKLFYIDKHAGDVSRMRDLTGRAYEDLPTAFAYRKKLKSGCSCRPMPWSAAERVRHARYAALEAYQKIEAERDRKAREAIALARAKMEAAQKDATQQASANNAMADASNIAVETRDGPPLVNYDLAGATSNAPRLADPALVLSDPESLQPSAMVPSLQAMRKAQRKRIARSRHTRRKRKKKYSGGFALGGWVPSGGNQKYTWPGDSRRR